MQKSLRILTVLAFFSLLAVVVFGGDFLGRAFSPQQNQPSLAQAALDYENAVIGVAERSAPAVVAIIASKDVPVFEQCAQDGSAYPLEFQEFFNFSIPCQTGTTSQEVGGGTGFFVTSDGYLLTNKHVVDDPDATYTVFTQNGTKYDAKVIAHDPLQDLAVVKVEGLAFPTLPLGNSDGLKLGQTAIAIGNAFGEFRNTVSRGVVSGVGRTISAVGSRGLKETLPDLIQTDAAINPGNSGGPLLNIQGEVIGINTAVAEGAQSIGFAIPINRAKRSFELAKDTGTITAPYLGIRYRNGEGGVLITGDANDPAVVPGSPADKAGLKEGDLLTAIDSRKVQSIGDVEGVLGTFAIGDSVVLTLENQGNTRNVNVTLGQRP